MSRETKVGMLVGLGVILLVGIIVSDHLSAARKQEHARQVTDLAPASQDSLVAKGDGDQALNPETRHTAIPLPGEEKQQAKPASVDVQGQNKDSGASIVFGGEKPPGGVKGQTASNTGTPTLVTPVSIKPEEPGQSHIVKQGDSLYGIAKLYYKNASPTQIAQIRDANKTSIGKNDALKLGTKLTIPALTPKAAPAPVAAATGADAAKPASTDGVFGNKPASASNTVTVEKGQTLGTIAAKYLGSANRWSEIKALNKGIDPNNLKVGTKLVLPAAKADAEAKSEPAKAEAARTDSKIKPVPLSAAPATPASPLAPTLPARLAPAASTPVSSAATPASLPAPATPIASAVKPVVLN